MNKSKIINVKVYYSFTRKIWQKFKMAIGYQKDIHKFSLNSISSMGITKNIISTLPHSQRKYRRTGRLNQKIKQLPKSFVSAFGTGILQNLKNQLITCAGSKRALFYVSAVADSRRLTPVRWSFCPQSKGIRRRKSSIPNFGS